MPSYADQIAKTGFVLENRIAQELRAAKWTVISNRYYVDDAEESIREIDLVAYQVTKVRHLDIYTTLIISCKKNESNAWALLARDTDRKNPNYDWSPLHAWTNDKAVQYKLNDAGCPARYHLEVGDLGVERALSPPSVEVFAFQEMSKANGSPQNDKNIFAAVTSLMKAQAYEMGSLPQRKKTPAVYQFNLLSVVDTDLVRLDFKSKVIREVAIESEHYIARYIVRKKETFSRIRFLSAGAFSSQLPDYGRLHKANCTWFERECESFYVDLIKDSKKVDVFLEDFRKSVAWYLGLRVGQYAHSKVDGASISLYWSDKQQCLEVLGPFGDAGSAFLNEDERSKAHIAKALKLHYRYEGPFTFSDMPF